MKPKFTWKEGERLYVNGHDLFAGNWHVATVAWDGVIRRLIRERKL